MASEKCFPKSTEHAWFASSGRIEAFVVVQQHGHSDPDARLSKSAEQLNDGSGLKHHIRVKY